jgi:hypothetical protein
MVWPFGWVCHAVGAPGAKWTLAACALQAVDPGEPEAPVRSGRDRRSRVLAALLIPVALVVLDCAALAQRLPPQAWWGTVG